MPPARDAAFSRHAEHQAAGEAVRTAARERLENLHYRSTVKTLTRRLRNAVADGDADGLRAAHVELQRWIDRRPARSTRTPPRGRRRRRPGSFRTPASAGDYRPGGLRHLDEGLGQHQLTGETARTLDRRVQCREAHDGVELVVRVVLCVAGAFLTRNSCRLSRLAISRVGRSSAASSWTLRPGRRARPGASRCRMARGARARPRWPRADSRSRSPQASVIAQAVAFA